MRQMSNPPERKEFIRHLSGDLDLYEHPDYKIYYYYDRRDETWWRLNDNPRRFM